MKQGFQLVGTGFVILLTLGLAGVTPVTSLENLPTDCVELLTNGDFEDGATDWNQSSAGGYDLVSDFNPRTGSWGAFLAGANNADDRLSQRVAIPPDASAVTLTFWWSMITQEGAVIADTLVLSVRRPDGVWLADLLAVDNTAESDIWLDIVIDLMTYRGQEVLLQWHAQTGGSYPTSFFLDDISVMGCGVALPSPTPLPSSTPTGATATAVAPTPTATPTVPSASPTLTPTGTLAPEVRWKYLPLVSRRQ